MHKIGKGGSLSSRQAILHSLVHIESWAVDLSWDVIERFGSDPAYSLPDEFISDFVQVTRTHPCPPSCILMTHCLSLSWTLHSILKLV